MRNVSNPAHHPELEKQKMELEEQLRLQFAGQIVPAWRATLFGKFTGDESTIRARLKE